MPDAVNAEVKRINIINGGDKRMKYIVKAQVELKVTSFCSVNGSGGACGERTAG